MEYRIILCEKKLFGKVYLKIVRFPNLAGVIVNIYFLKNNYRALMYIEIPTHQR